MRVSNAEMSLQGEPSIKVSSGLVHLTRLHSERNHSITSTDSLFLLSSANKDERSWSWKTLREQFQTKESEQLFEKYQTRLQHSFFLVFLVLNLILNTLGIINYFID